MQEKVVEREKFYDEDSFDDLSRSESELNVSASDSSTATIKQENIKNVKRKWERKG